MHLLRLRRSAILCQITGTSLLRNDLAVRTLNCAIDFTTFAQARIPLSQPQAQNAKRKTHMLQTSYIPYILWNLVPKQFRHFLHEPSMTKLAPVAKLSTACHPTTAACSEILFLQSAGLRSACTHTRNSAWPYPLSGCTYVFRSVSTNAFKIYFSFRSRPDPFKKRTFYWS